MKRTNATLPVVTCNRMLAIVSVAEPIPKSQTTTKHKLTKFLFPNKAKSVQHPPRSTDKKQSFLKQWAKVEVLGRLVRRRDFST